MVGEVLREPRVHPVPRPRVRRIGRGPAAAGREAELGVQRDQVPARVVGTRADVEGVVAEPVGSPHGVAEVPEVPARGRGRIVVVLVVARRGGDLGLRAAPGRIEEARVGGVRTALVLVVAEQEHAGQVRPVDQVGGVVVLAVRGRTRTERVVLARDVARGRDDEPRGPHQRVRRRHASISGRSEAWADHRGRDRDHAEQDEGPPHAPMLPTASPRQDRGSRRGRAAIGSGTSPGGRPASLEPVPQVEPLGVLRGHQADERARPSRRSTCRHGLHDARAPTLPLELGHDDHVLQVEW